LIAELEKAGAAGPPQLQGATKLAAGRLQRLIDVEIIK
jgi:hypothetical protein